MQVEVDLILGLQEILLIHHQKIIIIVVKMMIDLHNNPHNQDLDLIIQNQIHIDLLVRKKIRGLDLHIQDRIPVILKYFC